MKLLFIGDSLVKGTVGVNWVQKIATDHKSWNIINEGKNGDTLVKITQRLEQRLASEPAFDAIVFEAGHNDLLIPFFSAKGFFFKRIYRYLLNRGYLPLEDPANFENALREAVSLMQRKTSATIILCTLSCLKEDLSFSLNKKRALYNACIRKIAAEKGCRLADVGAVVDGFLQLHSPTDYFLESFFDTTLFDKFQCKIPGGIDQLSRKRKLIITIDGLHLNFRGATLFRQEVEKQLSGL